MESPNKSGSPGRRSRSPSPMKTKINIDTSSELYKQAMSKFVVAASKFNALTIAGSLWLKSIENRELDKELFRGSLRSGMNCKLTPEEFDALHPHFDNNGYVNGCEFTLLFYRTRFEYKSKLLTERIAKEKAVREKDQKFLEARRAEIESKNVFKVSFDFTPEQREQSMEKVRMAAWKFDRASPTAANLDAFECEYMTPENFKEQCRRCFNLKFTAEEFGAYLSEVGDKDDNYKVYCAEFLVNFLRKGLEERTKKMKENWALKEKIDNEKKALEIARLEEQEGKNKQSVTKFTEADKIKALKKMKQAAYEYDKAMPGAMSMSNFDAAYMEPFVFKEQLRRVFNLTVSAPELSAIISIFDEKNTGKVPCQEFAKTFLAMGFMERENRDKQNLERQRLADALRKQEAIDKMTALENKAKLNVVNTFSEEDNETAFVKMNEAAWKFEKGGPGAPNLDAFDMKYMEPHIFREQLKRAFNMPLSPGELAALVAFFDPSGTGQINCQEFLRRFLRIGIEAREHTAARWRELQRKNDQKAKEAEEAKKNATEQKVHLNLGEFTQKHLDSALNKVSHAAAKYHKSPSDVLDAFEALYLPPHVFQAQLRLVFNIRINLQELAALVSYYDQGSSENSGVVNCKQFLNNFLRMGYDQRNHMYAGWRELTKQKQEQDKLYWLSKEKEKEMKQLAEVDFEFTEEDFDKALTKFVKMAHAFEQRQLGPAGWKAFTSSSFRPAEFRQTLRRTFEIKVSDKELGALVHFFLQKQTSDVTEKVVDCAFFLQMFTQARVNTEAMKNKPDEAEKMVEYKEKLKEQYRLRLEKMGGTVDQTRPWRTTVKLTKNARGIVSMQQKVPYPETPQEKITRRLNAGKTSGRMDLATKVRWPEGDANAGLVQVGTQVGAKKVNRKTTILKKGGNLRERSQKINQSAHAAAAELDGEDVRIKADFKLLNIPQELFNMVHLTELWLCNNMLGGIPSYIGSFRDLKILGLTNNDLSMLPEEVCTLTKLEKLYINRNNLKTLPEGFMNLTNLVDIDATSNKFEEFPLVLCTLPRLLTISFNKNSIKTIPEAIKNLRSLQLLQLEHNPISEGGPQTVLTKMYWLETMGVPLPQGNLSSKKFNITKEEELELQELFKSKALGRMRRGF